MEDSGSKQKGIQEKLIPKEEDTQTMTMQGANEYAGREQDESSQLIQQPPSTLHPSPQFRKSSRHGQWANYVPLGGDKVRPPDTPVAYINALMIILPTSYVMAYTNIALLGWQWGIVVDIFHALSMLNCLRLIYKTATTEPGIIPCIPTPGLDMAQEISVEYIPESSRDYVGDKNEHYFSQKRYRITRILDPSKDIYKLTVCTTCGIIRPPRSFHCTGSGCCIEEHDHYCPWMGTAIGKRNVSYFIGFLFYTSFHAAITFCLCLALFQRDGGQLALQLDDYQGFDALQSANMAMLVYTAMIGATLLAFASYTFSLTIGNITSNENMRGRWNAKHDKFVSRQRTLFRDSYESLTPSQMDASEQDRRDQTLEEQRLPSFWQKSYHFFFTRQHDSLMENYMRLREMGMGESASAYSAVNNLAVLDRYGIHLPTQTADPEANINN